ncbi:MAG: hypothetical protein NT106_12930 [Candidatus Sumerlaeota bacterium]|nr:hypothetical protein [Candidatus Sumerlaeota bacterium]
MKKIMILFCLIAFVFLVILIAYRAKYATVKGLYLAEGISTVLQIEPRILTYKPEILYPKDGTDSLGNPVKIITSSGKMTIVSNVHGTYSYGALQFKPSGTTQGDWDLIGFGEMGGIPDAEKRVMRTITTLSKPISSYLHRIKDKKIIKYFESIQNNGGLKSDLSVAEKLFENYPTDPYICVIYLDALMRNDKWDELSRQNALLKDRISQTPNPNIACIPQLMEQAVASHKLSKEGQNAYDWLMKIGEPNPKESFESLLEKAAACKAGIPPVHPPSLLYGSVPNFLGVQVLYKVLRVQATFAMLKGNNERALHLLTLIYRCSQICCGPTNLLSNLIGISLKFISCGGMELYMANACKSPEEVKTFFDTLQNLKKIDATLRLDDFRRTESPFWNALYDEDIHYAGHLIETHVRWDTVEARSLLLLASAAARYHLLTSGKFPNNEFDFAPLLPQSFPNDPFSKTPLKFLTDGDVFKVYSVGPDKKDNRAAFFYDPTNGTVSDGDICIEIPRRSRYPFPPRGQLATTKEGLLKQFPNNLPTDPFNDGGLPLTIIDTTPAQIISFGPDCEASRVTNGAILMPLQYSYDPTNGTISPGDIIMDTSQQ